MLTCECLVRESKGEKRCIWKDIGTLRKRDEDWDCEHANYGVVTYSVVCFKAVKWINKDHTTHSTAKL